MGDAKGSLRDKEPWPSMIEGHERTSIIYFRNLTITIISKPFPQPSRHLGLYTLPQI